MTEPELKPTGEPFNSALALADYIWRAVKAAELSGHSAIMVTVPKPFSLPLSEARQIIDALIARRAPWKPEEIEALRAAARILRALAAGGHAATLERMIEER